MWIEFDRPERLILIPILALGCILLARKSLSIGPRGWWKVALRCTVIALVVAALAEPQRIDQSRDMTSVVIRDFSDSIPAAAHRTADDILARSLERRRDQDRVGLLTAAAETRVQQLPAASSQPLPVGYLGATAQTDLAQALSMVGGMAAGDSGLRVLLASDGNPTRGDVLAAARVLRAKGIVVDTLAMPTSAADALIVEEFTTPSWARPGSPINAKLVLRAAAAGEAVVSLRVNGDAIDLAPADEALSLRVNVQEGLNSFLIPLTVSDNPVQRFDAVISSGLTTTPADSLTFVQARGRVLVLADDSTSVAPLVDALRDEDVALEVRSEPPSELSEWMAFDAVVMVDQPASNYTVSQQQALRAAIEDAGVGLLVLGGPRSFGAGGWIGSDLAETFPIDPEPPQRRELPMGALAIIIDESGSMQAQVSGTNASQQQLANESAILAVKALRRLDQVVVIAFSDSALLTVPLTTAADTASIEKRIRTIGTGGGTNLFPAIDMAAAELAKSPAGVKHVIILTDGQTTGDPATGLNSVRKLAERGVTVTTIGIGDAANGGLLEALAITGRGRFHGVKSSAGMASLPQIFVDETRIVSRPMIWEGPAFTPKIEALTESVGGLLTQVPPVRGYIIAADRGGLSSVVLRGREDDPLLAQWRRGLGRVTAFTTDGLTRWTPDWVAWSAYRAFWKQQLAWLLRAPSDPDARLRMEQHGGDAVAVLDLIADDGSRVNPSFVEARFIDAAGATRPVKLQQTGPGTFQAIMERRDESPAGAGVITFRYEVPSATGSKAHTVRGSVPTPTNLERRFRSTDSLLLNQIAGITGGRTYLLAPQTLNLWDRENVVFPTSRLPIWPIVATAGIGLFIVDVGARRIAFRASAVTAAILALARPRAQQKGKTLESLAQARDRAREATARRAEPAPQANSLHDELLAADIRPTSSDTDVPPRRQPDAPRPAKPNADATPKETLNRLQDIKRRMRDRD